MLRPVIFVGCGGSGGKTLRVTRRMLEARLRRVGWDAGLPQAWQFVHIDVPSTQEGSIDDFGPLLPPECYLSLVDRGVEYEGVDDGLIRQIETSPEALAEIVGWRPNPAEVKIPIDQGAGQYRAVGRMIGLNAARAIAGKINEATGAISQGPSMESLRLAAERLGAKPGEMDMNPIIILVSSLAGGTGAGIFMDVADIIRAVCGGAGDRLLGVLYTSDVFRDVPGVAGVDGNSLAALAELMAGYWATDSRAMRLLNRQGVRATSVTQGGPSYPFLIGAANTSGIALNSQAEVYRAIGEALGMLVSSGEVQESMMKFLQTNWQTQASENADKLGLTTPDQMYGVASSFGYSRLGLGRDRFRDYSIKRLARDAAEFLNDGYLIAAQNAYQDEQLTPAEALRRIVEAEAENFLKACGLNERNHPDHKNDQIIDAIRPSALNDDWNSLVGRVLEDIASLPAAEAGTWFTRISNSCQPLETGYHTGVTNAGTQKALEWAEQTPGRILEVTAEFIGRHGIPVAAGLVENTINEMRAVGNDLLGEASDMRVDASQWAGRAGQQLPSGQNLQANFPHMPDAVKAVSSPLFYEAEAQLRDRASALMLELADQVLTPLLASLRAAQKQLESDLGPKADGSASDVLDWPRENLVPGWVKPSQVEMLLDEVDEYPDTFTGLIQASLGSDPESKKSGPVVAARRQLIAGGFESTAAAEVPRALRQEDRLAGTERTWHPRAAGGSGEPSQFVAEFGVEHLKDRAEAWVDRPGRFKDHFDESLSDYLLTHDRSGSQIVDHPDRLRAFRARFEAALGASAPLIDIEPNVYQKTHPEKPLAKLTAEILEPLPFPTGHPAREVAEAVLTRHGVEVGQLGDCFTGSAGAGVDSVGVVSYISAPVHPAVCKSVVEPIAAKFQTGGSGFWQWRRTRALPEAIPVSSEVRRAMVRGWYTARLLGMLNLSSRQAPYRVYDPEAGWLEFPFPLLGRIPGVNGLEQISAVLESMPLAMLGWGVWDREDYTAAYRRLFHLGATDVLRTDDLTYSAPSQELAHWISTGETPDGCQVVDALAHGEQATRASATAEFLRAQAAEYQAIADRPLNGRSALGAARGLTLAGEIAEEMGLLATVVEGAGPTGPQF